LVSLPLHTITFLCDLAEFRYSIPRSLVSFREHRPELSWITIQIDLERPFSVYSPFRGVLKTVVPRTTFPFLAPGDPGTR
jgi:hypothetical protein